MDVTESDHKPVRCKFHSTIAHVDRSVRRQAFGEIIQSNEKVRSLLDELRYVPETVVSTNNIVLQNQDTSILRITNKCEKEKAIFKIICEGQSTVKDDEEVADYHPRGSFGLPRWLEVLHRPLYWKQMQVFCFLVGKSRKNIAKEAFCCLELPN